MEMTGATAMTLLLPSLLALLHALHHPHRTSGFGEALVYQSYEQSAPYPRVWPGARLVAHHQG